MPGEAAEVVALAYMPLTSCSTTLFVMKTAWTATQNPCWSKPWPSARMIRSGVVAALRATWRSMKSTTFSSVPPPVAEKAATDCTALVPFLQASSRMSSGDRAKLVEKYENDYPGVGVCPMVLPSLHYLQCIKPLCSRVWHAAGRVSVGALSAVCRHPHSLEKGVCMCVCVCVCVACTHACCHVVLKPKA